MSGQRESGRLQKGRPRTGARLAAVQALFQSEQAGESPEAVIQQFVRHRLGPNDADEGLGEGRIPDADAKLFARLVRDTAARIEALDEIIGKALAKDWPLEKLKEIVTRWQTFKRDEGFWNACVLHPLALPRC